MNPPKNSYDPRWKGPLGKTALAKVCCSFFEYLEDCCLEDIDILLNSPEWLEFVEQAEHDYPYLLEEGELNLLPYMAERRQELEYEASFSL